MKVCPECGRKNWDKTKFCTGCGCDIRDVGPIDEPIEKPIKERKNGIDSRFILIGVLIIIIILLGAVFYFNANGDNGHVIPDSNLGNANEISGSNSDNADEQLIASDNSPDMKTVDFNGLFKMDVWEESKFSQQDSYHNSKYDWIQVNTDPSGNVEYVNYWENTPIEDVLDDYSSQSFKNPQTENDLVILSTDTNQYIVAVQSADNEVVVLEGWDLDVLKTYANSIVFE